MRCTHKRCHGWRGGRSTAHNHNSGHLRMSLDVPDVYLIERAPRCLCHASPRPPTRRWCQWCDAHVGRTYANESQAGTFRHQAGCWQLPPEGWRRLPQYYLRPILNGAADVLPTWCYIDRGGEVNAHGVRPLVNNYGMRHITSCVSARRVGWCRAAQCGDDSAKKNLRFTHDPSTALHCKVQSYIHYI